MLYISGFFWAALNSAVSIFRIFIILNSKTIICFFLGTSDLGWYSLGSSWVPSESVETSQLNAQFGQS